ncbi:(2Fe-2S)-binding protein [Govanella unica]|uniref:succinate dehydrogenase n=1 Tax=Govanella unica TaxID=2975056 RepID=A0A9X3TYL4_9PROT|nr:2Fe-2S iron-sulfur cluster-binding protein [Govania unica]MDA5194129.1 2Fe-2S iron-sulfur cluster-binding protein [Govania unica]
MSGMLSIGCTVNDREKRAEVSPLTTLAGLLRDHLGLTATRVGCEEGVCGSCTVLMNGQSVRACLTLAAQADGARIETAEGYGGDPLSVAIQDAFVKYYGAQCGFCTSGMMAVIREYLTDKSVRDHGDETVIRNRLSAVACRCTGYQPIVRLVQSLVRGGHDY